MTNSTANHSTITNQLKATKVSPLESKDSNKNEILNSFKAGKLRKNAKHKIAALLSVATCITLQTQSMGLDDCFDYNEPKVIDIVEFWAWYEQKYNNLDIYINAYDGVVTQVTFSDCPYHFSNDVVLTFDVIDETVTNENIDVIEPIILADLSGINMDVLDDMPIKNIEIIWSESNYFTDGEILTLEQYDSKSMIEALEIGRGKGYAKTKINIHLANGEVIEHRHDIDADYPTLTIDLAHCGGKAIQIIVKPLFTYEQVKQALDAGYVSPLNHDGKQPEPTPTNDKNCRSVVSFGDYKDRIESKRERLESRAEKASQQSNSYYLSSKNLADMIPFGQPILVGHHSEGKARRHADKIFNDMGKSVAAGKKAEYLENKAANLGKNGIASDDPEAIQKLKSKLAALESAQEKMKAANKVIKSKHMTNSDKIEYLITTLKFSDKQANELLEGDFCGRVGFASYTLTNNNANIRQTKQRLEELEVMHNQEPLSDSGEIEGLSWSLYEEDGRIKFSFDGKPSEAVRNVLKSNGFKWSRYSMAWVRKITANAVFSTKRMIPDLK
ncbi:DUF3560 domain-containing protein [Photobacterium phosphoreum]|uniref:DUF3560 domain-containing protein n=1 Tax=Photobacterium phosphoreum TaxID=659 RepID=A0AAW4ZWE9_PHOPO|nr:DUF3560 domain-containing protein [Photobacterium phosphoreum]MCD9492600.1 DUF3560 domain-containing protein [Photobacterium phosphoreum]MCF2191835.1 DUF3560 domain-containing protein [Photobacterium phosphoreum]MCF2303432.1 DUF3560 domain-containing protein [Photobacterium phosphoreum]